MLCCLYLFINFFLNVIKKKSSKMSSTAPAIPKTPFATPKRLGIHRTPVNSASKMNISTPKTKKPEISSDTPECFSQVSLETPISKRRNSKEKFDEVSNLTVAVRIRPMNSKELMACGVSDVVKIRDRELTITVQNNGGANIQHTFQYDYIFCSSNEENPLFATQEDVFMTIGMPLLNSAFKGYNACLFAYGQTGSGKSFSMMGKNMYETIDIESEEYSGIIPRFCRDLFNRISKLDEKSLATVEVSYFEIYNEKIHDLLSTSTNSSKTPLKVREHPEWGPYVVDLTVHTVKSYKELRNWLLMGNKNRATAATTMNEKSSRSHSIFSIELCLSEELNQVTDTSRRSKVSLVDLAGSERLGHYHNTDEKIRQGVCINKSLMTLGKVISALADQKKNQFVPYRDSVLTWLLRESLGGNSRTSMLATISPASTQLDETLSTLRYACQARSIVNKARVNENPHDRLIRELRLEVERLKALRQDYERKSLSSSTSSIILINSSGTSEEQEELRKKLNETEKKLLEAQKNWEERFMETKRDHLKQLAEAEKCKAELESKVRVLKTADNDVHLSPYRTNFLEELQGVLTEDDDGEKTIVDNIKTWCLKNGLTCNLNDENLIIKDLINKKQSFLAINKLDMRGYENIEDLMKNLTWVEINKPVRKLSKTEILSSMNQVYQILGNLQPSDSENNLNLLFAKLNKSLQNFETALLNNLKNNGQKTVTFNM